MATEDNTINETSEKRPGKALLIAAVVAVLVVVAVGGLWAARYKRKGRSAPEPKTVALEVIHLESFLVNLGEPSKESFLRLGIDLGLDRGPESAADKEKGEIPVSQIRDTILDVITSANSEALLLPEGKSRLKQQLAGSLQARLPRLGVREVYLTDFLVQR